MATAKVSFIDEEEEVIVVFLLALIACVTLSMQLSVELYSQVVYTKVEEEDLSIEGSSGKPTQTKDGGTSTVVRHQEVEPQVKR